MRYGTRREEEARDAGYDPHPDDFRSQENAELTPEWEIPIVCYTCGSHLKGGLCPECTTTMEGQEHD